MRDLIPEVLRLRHNGKTWDQIAAETGASRETVRGLHRRHAKKPEFKELVAPGGDGYAAPARVVAQHPKGWEQGFELNSGKGTIASGPLAEGQAPDWGFVMRELHLDPDLYEVVEPINVRSWDALKKAVDGETNEVVRLWYYKANVIARRSAEEKLDLEQLKAEIASHTPYLPAGAGDGEGAFVVCLSDWQIGKRDGDGTRGVVDRVLHGIDSTSMRVDELRAIGRRLGTLYIAGMGDLHEGCDGHYAMQTFQAELNRRDQVKVTRRLLREIITALAPYFDKVVVLCVPGNHGENRKDGKAFTSFGDNDDVAVFEQVAEVFDGHPAYEHVKFVVPGEELSVTLDVGGAVTTFIHGHQAHSGPTPQKKAENWWKGQAFGFQPAIDSTVLVSAHYHHFSVVSQGGRTQLQCPALESESSWFKETSGIKTTPGILTFAVVDGRLQDLQVL